MQKRIAGTTRALAGTGTYVRRAPPADNRVSQTAAHYEVRRRSDRTGPDAAAEERDSIIRRQSRIAALERSSGLGAGEPGHVPDTLVYQEAMRVEWQ